MIYFTADLHLGHENIIHHCSRPFRTVEEMDRALIDAWNKRVGPEDTVYILGDLMFSCKDPAGYLRQLAGKKHLILGNHDAVWMKRLKKTEPGLPEAAFESIQQAAEITVDNCRVTLSHYPMMTWNGFAEGTYLIYGHIHNGTEATYWPLLSTMGHALNAGVDVNSFQPVTLEELKANNDAFRRAHQGKKPDSVDEYFALAAQRPDLFIPSNDVPLVMDPDLMRAFAAEAGKPMGLVYDNRPYYMVLADLCTNGKRSYSYARVVYPRADTNGSVAVPHREGKFGLLRIFRHAPRTECLEFPRGFAAKGLTPQENIRKELREEMGATVREVRYLGSVRPDTGLSAGCAQVFLAEVEEAAVQVGHEGIRELVWLTEAELRREIADGRITDGFTLAALTLCTCGSTQ